ncbi:hypothetical protein S40288_11438 [Stachybotrys chartarum IBT 40288]|nr:hypothetical protein S40288_11438 [Stachybotrys chartarum IBT 40288]
MVVEIARLGLHQRLLLFFDPPYRTLRLLNRDHAIISQFTIITRRDRELGAYDYGALAAESTPAQHSARLTLSEPNAKAGGSTNHGCDRHQLLAFVAAWVRSKVVSWKSPLGASLTQTWADRRQHTIDGGASRPIFGARQQLEKRADRSYQQGCSRLSAAG